MYPARQIRLGAVILVLLVASAAPIRSWAQAAGRPAATPPPQAPRPAAPQPHAESEKKRDAKKRDAKKSPPLSTRVEWTHELPSPPAAFPAYLGDTAFVPLTSGQVAAVSLADGKVSWTVSLETAGALAAGEGLVFVPSTGGIETRAAATGESRWRFPIEARLSMPLVWQNGWLLAGTEAAELVMLRAATGERLWRREMTAPVRRATLTGERLYVALENGHLAALALATGETIWDRDLGARTTALAPLDDRIYLGADDKFLYCLSAANGKRHWRWRTGGIVVGTPAFDEDNVYFLSLDNMLRALDRGGGNQKWHAPVPFRPIDGPVLKGRLLLVTGLVEVRAYQREDGSEAGAAQVTDPLAAAPHFLPPTEPDTDVGPFIVFTREAQIIEFVPLGPPLDSKPFPPTPVYPLYPLYPA